MEKIIYNRILKLFILFSSICLCFVFCFKVKAKKQIPDEEMIILTNVMLSLCNNQEIQRISYHDGHNYYFYYFNDGEVGIISTDLQILKVCNERLSLISTHAKSDYNIDLRYQKLIYIVDIMLAKNISEISIDKENRNAIRIERFDNYSITNIKPRYMSSECTIVNDTWYIYKR